MTTTLPIKSNNSRLIRIPNDTATNKQQQFLNRPLLNSLSATTTSTSTSTFNANSSSNNSSSKQDWNSALNQNQYKISSENNNNNHHRNYNNSGEENILTSSSSSSSLNSNKPNSKKNIPPQASLSLYQQFLTGKSLPPLPY